MHCREDQRSAVLCYSVAREPELVQLTVSCTGVQCYSEGSAADETAITKELTENSDT